MAKGPVATSSTLTLVKGALKIMAWTKTKATIVAGVIVLLAAATTTVTVEVIQEHRTYPWQGPVCNYLVLKHVTPQVRLLPARYPASPGGWVMGADGLIGLNQPAIEVVRHVYGDSPRNVYTAGLEARLPRGSYDFIGNLGRGQSQDFEALRQTLKEKWGVVGKTEMLNEDVIMLTIKPSSVPHLQTSKTYYYMMWKDSGTRLECRHSTLSDFANLISLAAQFPIVDETGLTSVYDFDLDCDYTSLVSRDWNHVNQALDSLGLQLVSTNLPIEMFVIEKTK
jgi:hypothetical protein